MKKRHERSGAPHRVAEPVQVYLTRTERGRLDRLAAQMGTTKSAVLREALAALEQQLTDVSRHPALRVIGIAGDSGTPDTADVAREHDRYLADAHDQPTVPPPRRKRDR